MMNKRPLLERPDSPEDFPILELLSAFVGALGVISHSSLSTLRRAARMKIKTWETMIKGTRNVGSRLRGNSRNACIDFQSSKPILSAVETTNMMSNKPIVFHANRKIRL